MKQIEERPKALRDKVFDRLFEEAEIAKFTPQELREYEASKVAYRDIKNSIDTAKKEGLAEGMEKGLAEGMEKGLAEGMKKGLAEGKNKQQEKTALDMLSDGMDIDLIAKYSGLSKEQIERLANL